MNTAWIGHRLDEKKCRFRLWAPLVKNVSLKLHLGRDTKLYPMSRDLHGYWETSIKAGPSKYYYILDSKLKRADPASFWQPEGVFGPSKTIDLKDFKWDDLKWRPPPLKDLIIYELHTGTFSPKGDLPSIIERFSYLKELGINAVELMPAAQFSGSRNWGYDGVFPFAVHDTYGGPRELQHLVNEAHLQGMAVILDVVYNHLGPEGNYFSQFAPYFTTAYNTAWGEAVNFDGPGSREVRNFFIYNALFWFKYFHIDALRLDAVHGIFDFSATHFLEQLAGEVKRYCSLNKKTHYLIAESDLNNSHIVREKDEGGYGIHAQWNDDFHHSLHACLTGERDGYYADFGKVAHIKKALEEGYCYDGNYSPYRKRLHGNSSRGLKGDKFITYIQNHDQVGNRMLGERLSVLVPFEAYKLAAAMVILSHCIPLLFMGEEYGETKPFLYFTSHKDPDLARAVARGRADEFSGFSWKGRPPNPQHIQTFMDSKPAGPGDRRQKLLLGYYKALISFRKKNLGGTSPMKVSFFDESSKILVFAPLGKPSLLYISSFNGKDVQAPLSISGTFENIFCSSEKKWGGPGNSLPSRIGGKTTYTIRGHSLNIYRIAKR